MVIGIFDKMGVSTYQTTLEGHKHYGSNCSYCGKKFNKKYHTEKYCCDTCRKKAVREQKLKYNHENRIIGEVIVKCQYCGKEFIRKHNAQIYCNDNCKRYALLEQQAEYSRKRRKSIQRKELVSNERTVVGTNYLASHPCKDWDKEQAAILKEMKRLKIR